MPIRLRGFLASDPALLLFEISCLVVFFWLEGIFPLFLERSNRVHHTLTNYSLSLCNRLLGTFALSWITFIVFRWVNDHPVGLLHHLPLNFAAKAVATFFLFDLWMYIIHLIHHKVPLLWRLHSVHHSDLEVDASTALRAHFGEFLIAIVGSWFAVLVFGLDPKQLIVYYLCVKPLVLFHHSNIALPEKVDHFLRYIIVTPNMHRVHHSREYRETNSNYSSFFSFWDRIGRTFRQNLSPGTINYGLRYLTDPKWHTLKGLFKTPLASIPSSTGEIEFR